MGKTEEQLAIAIKALKHYATQTNWQMCYTEDFRNRHYAFVADEHQNWQAPEGYIVAEKALQEIRALDKSEIPTT